MDIKSKTAETVTDTTEEVSSEVSASEATQGATEVEGTELGSGAEVAKEELPYTPNFKYRATGEEHEIDEWARPLITNKDLEEKFRDLWSRAHGIDKYKADFHEISSKYEEINHGLDTLREYIANNDFDSFFKAINIPLERVFQWVNEKISYHQLPPEEKKIYDEYMMLRKQNAELQRSAQGLSTQSIELQTLRNKIELGELLSLPEYSKVEQEFDARSGEPGDFRRFVAECGEAIELRTGEVCSAEKALQTALKQMRRFGYGTATTSQGGTQPHPGTVVVSGDNKPVIPNIKGTGTSPVKKKPQSLKELREYVEQRRAQ